MALKPANYAYEIKTRFTVTPDTILPHPHSMSLAVTFFEGPSEIRQELKVTTPFPARNTKKPADSGVSDSSAAPPLQRAHARL
jgi:hypothetical protein